MKKIFTMMLAVLLMLSVIACGGQTTAPAAESKPASSSNSQPAAEAAPAAEPAAETASYQLVGVYQEEGSYAATINGAFLCNLNSDGTAVIDRYKFSNYDASPAATNPTYEANFMTGTWKSVEKDGIESLQVKVACVDAAGNESNAGTFYANEVAGEWSFDLNFPIVVGAGYTRTVTLAGTTEKKFADGDAFIAAYKQEFVAPENVGEFVAEGNTVAYLIADGTLKLYQYFAPVKDGTWAKTADGVQITLDGAEMPVTVEGNKASFTYTYDRGDGTMTDAVLVCEDISVLPEAEVKEAEAPAADAPYTAKVKLGDQEFDAKLTLNEDGTGTIEAAVTMNIKYQKVGNAVVIEADGELEGFGAQIFPNIAHAWLLDDATKTMTALKGAYMLAEKVAFYLKEDGTMKAEYVEYAFGVDTFEYELSEDGTKLTVKAPEEMGAFKQVWDAMGGVNFTLEGTTATLVTE